MTESIGVAIDDGGASSGMNGVTVGTGGACMNMLFQNGMSKHVLLFT